MKCPHCDYTDLIYTDDGEFTGHRGNFFELTTPMTQNSNNPKMYYMRTAFLCGCPDCMKTFIKVK